MQPAENASQPHEENVDDAAARRAAPIDPHLILFSLTIFVSAALLFAVQPIFTKMVLPRLGGSASVWSIAIVFFQMALLAGYAYSHLLTTRVPARLTAVVHLAVMLAATPVLPLAIAAGWDRPPARAEELWTFGLFAVSIGLPFFALSANAPLLQAWFARSGHMRGEDPYFLYAASNAGSLLALVSYPFVVEPLTRLGQQSVGWTVGYFGLAVLIAACAALMWRAGARGHDLLASGAAETRPSWRDAFAWTALSAVPSGLLVAVTAHLSTDLAPSPLLWVMPLTLYLATFILAFRAKPVLPQPILLGIQALLILGVAATIVFTVIEYLLAVVALHLAAFFVTALVCHGELARRRPAAGHLTTFYLWMSLGGVIGGVAAGLVAPHVFSWIAEYPILIVLSILCRPGLFAVSARQSIAIAVGILVLAAIVVIPAVSFGYSLDDRGFYWSLGILLAFALAAAQWRNPLAFAGLVMLAFMLYRTYEIDSGRLRSFFGVHRIVDRGDGYRVLQHGTTIHGAERIEDIAAGPATRPLPATYYHEQSAMVQAVAAARARKGGPIRVAVVGLGTGTISCYMAPGDDWTYYEVDPAVVRIARDPSRFTFLSACAPDVPIVLGDARITLREAPDASFDLILIDAFSSDTIPVHLITREAMAGYVDKLAPEGIVAMHISNRYMELTTVVAGIAEANGLIARANFAEDGTDYDAYRYSSQVVVAARAAADFGALADEEKWIQVRPHPGQRTWTDDYSNIVGAILRQMRQQ